jgi:hypothetical protein
MPGSIDICFTRQLLRGVITNVTNLAADGNPGSSTVSLPPACFR